MDVDIVRACASVVEKNCRTAWGDKMVHVQQPACLPSLMLTCRHGDDDDDDCDDPINP